jgi:hypothetical protein
MAKRKQKYYTVIGVYTENNQPWIQWIKKGERSGGAISPKDAALMALTSGVIAEYPSGNPAVIEVLEGKFKGVLGNEKLLALWDNSELKEVDK